MGCARKCCAPGLLAQSLQRCDFSYVLGVATIFQPFHQVSDGWRLLVLVPSTLSIVLNWISPLHA
jgi:hypothetical protein